MSRHLIRRVFVGLLLLCGSIRIYPEDYPLQLYMPLSFEL